MMIISPSAATCENFLTLLDPRYRLLGHFFPRLSELDAGNNIYVVYFNIYVCVFKTTAMSFTQISWTLLHLNSFDIVLNKY